MKKFIFTLLVILGLYAAFILVYSLIQSAELEEEREIFMKCDGLETDWTGGYQGGAYGKCLHDNGYECDYGYSEKYTGCCDEDNYLCEICTSNSFDCSDFEDQESAQSLYQDCRDFSVSEIDLHNLDTDGDGIACESLKTVKD